MLRNSSPESLRQMSDAPRPDPGSMPLATARWGRLWNLLGPFIALAAVVLLFSAADSWMNGEKATFLTGRNLTTVAAQTATVAVAALGMTVIIIAGGIDLSAGTAIALCATVLAWCLKEDVATRLIAGDNVASVTAQL